jgi:GNAT superfamily N-acetyltransferase
LIWGESSVIVSRPRRALEGPWSAPLVGSALHLPVAHPLLHIGEHVADGGADLMTARAGWDVRIAQLADAESVGQLLHDFNREYDEPTPDPDPLAERIRYLIDEGHATILLGGAGPDGLAVLRFRPSIWTLALECYLAELYVVPQRRREGLGRALLQAAIELARSEGADHMDLGTGEQDVAARALYESFGFSNREGKPDGPINYFYEREL